MPKFTLTAEHKDFNGKVTSTTTNTFEVDYLPDVLENIELFLRGTGFYFDGDLDIINESHNDSVEHSEFYFDINRNK